MELDRPLGDNQLRGDRAIARAARHQAQHVELAPGEHPVQPRVAVGSRPGRLSRERLAAGRLAIGLEVDGTVGQLARQGVRARHQLTQAPALLAHAPAQHRPFDDVREALRELPDRFAIVLVEPLSGAGGMEEADRPALQHNRRRHVGGPVHRREQRRMHTRVRRRVAHDRRAPHAHHLGLGERVHERQRVLGEERERVRRSLLVAPKVRLHRHERRLAQARQHDAVEPCRVAQLARRATEQLCERSLFPQARQCAPDPLVRLQPGLGVLRRQWRSGARGPAARMWSSALWPTCASPRGRPASPSARHASTEQPSPNRRR